MIEQEYQSKLATLEKVGIEANALWAEIDWSKPLTKKDAARFSEMAERWFEHMKPFFQNDRREYWIGYLTDFIAILPEQQEELRARMLEELKKLQQQPSVNIVIGSPTPCTS